MMHAKQNKANTSSLPASIETELQKVLKILEKYNARRVILYGSFARGDFRDDSDFDLCVEGLSSGDFFLALAECLMTATRPLSIVDLKDARGYFRERILMEGLVIYDATGVSERSPIRT
jgi:predicted nucleotidyltransferase